MTVENSNTIIHIQSLSHEGKVIVFGVNYYGQLFYTVRQSGFEDSVLKAGGEIVDEALDGFEAWKSLNLDSSIRDKSVIAFEKNNLVDESGRQLLKSAYESEAAKSLCAQVKLISALGHIYLFRISTAGYLMMDRFVLDGMTNEMIPKLEVRYRRSQQKLVGEESSGGASQDSLDFRDIDENPFYEPSLSLNFLGKFSKEKPWFSVEQCSTNEHEKFRWNFFVYIDEQLKLFSVAASAEGLINLKDQVKIQPDPDATDKRILTRVAGIIERKIDFDQEVVGPFDSTLYNNQVERTTKAGKQLMKEGTRVMLSVPVSARDNRGKATNKALIASVSFAVNNLGMLAQIDCIVDDSQLLRGEVKELLLPLSTLDDIKMYADTSPAPMGSIKKVSQGEEEMLQVTSAESIENLEAGKSVKISGTRSYNGCYVANNITPTGFEIPGIFVEEESSSDDSGSTADKGYWEVVEDDNSGLVFENMIASYEKTDTGSLKISCPAHNLSDGDEIQIAGSVNQDGTYPIRDINEDNSFLVDTAFPVGEVINLSKVKRRGLSFDGDGDHIITEPFALDGHKAKRNLARSFGCWVYLDELSDLDQTVMSSYGEDSFHLFIDEKGRANFRVRFADGSRVSIKDKDSVPLKTWFHLTALVNYYGECSGKSELCLARSGVVVARQEVEANKPVHLGLKSLKLQGEGLAVEKLALDKKAGLKELTLEAWVNTKQNGKGVIASFDAGEYWELALSGDKKKRVVEFSTTALKGRRRDFDSLIGSVHIRDNHWYHIAATYDSHTGKKIIYVNGVADVQVEAHKKKPLGTGKKRFGYIGLGSKAESVGGLSVSDTGFKGLIADLRIWDCARCAEDINRDQIVELTGLEKNLFAHWCLEETITNKLVESTRAKAHIKKPDTVEWATAQHRIPGLSKWVQADSYAQAYSLAMSWDSRKKSAKNEFKGKLSEFQVWSISLPEDSLKTSIYNKLSGSEYGLVGYWKLGGIVQDTLDSTKRITPDFSSNSLEAQVFGQTYVSACDLYRANALGKAVAFSNDELVSVSQGATYCEKFEFRAQRSGGEAFSLSEINNADGMKHPLFAFKYWGKKSRSSDEIIDFPAAIYSMEAFEAAGSDGWFEAKCTFTIPEGVNMIRCFGIDKVSGKWLDELSAPEDEWSVLNIRKHSISLISDSITCEQYTDELELPILADKAVSLQEALRDIPATELEISQKHHRLTEVIEEIDLYENVQKFEREKTGLEASTELLESSLKTLKTQRDSFAKNPLNYQMVWKAKESGKVLDLSNKKENSQVYIYGQHCGDNQVWEFIAQQDGSYKILSLANKQYLSATKHGDITRIKKADSKYQYWTVKKQAKGYYSIHNKATGQVLDVYGHGRSNKSKVVLWGFNGQNNQLWQLVPFSSFMRFEWKLNSKLRSLPGVMRSAVKKAHESKLKSLKKQFPLGQPKSSYKDEFKKIEKSYKSTEERLKTDTARLKRLTTLLANRSAKQLTALKKERDNLIKAVVALDQSLAGLHTNYLKAATAIENSAQKMTLLNCDKQGLKTFGALLGFAFPHSGISSTASAEGNVQLSYFDNQGRMQFTNYDACSGDNSTYEEWIPNSSPVCTEFGAEDDLVRFDTVKENGSANRLELSQAGFTVETWFYYPPSFKQDGSPYWINKLTSDKDDNEAVIAILDNRRLGTVVDGFFHDSGWDLERNLSHGWHHVAAVSNNNSTEFYMDGVRVGLDHEKLQSSPRQAMQFSGKNQYIQLAKESSNYSSGFTVQAWVKFDSFRKWSRIIDFGSGSDKDNIIFANVGSSNDLAINIRQGSKAKQLTAKGVLEKGEWMYLSATIDASGTANLYVNAQEVAYGECCLPNSTERTHNYIGRSNFKRDQYFKGQICDLQIYNRTLQAHEISESMFSSPAGDESGLIHYWPMRTKDVNGDLVVADGVESKSLHGSIKNGAKSVVLEKSCSLPIVALGNSAKGAAPFGRISEFRLWNTELDAAEIKVNSRTLLNGNEPDLAHYYPLNETSGNYVFDHTTDGSTTIKGSRSSGMAKACTAPIGNPGSKVIDFDGENDSISLKGIGLKKKSFTVEFWVKRAEVNRADWLFYQGSSRKNLGLHIGFRNATTYALAFYGNDLNKKGNWPAHTWMHIANTYDAKTKQQYLYLNGELCGKRKAAEFLGSGDFIIGGTRSSFFKGQMADIRIWGTARSSAEIQTNWQTRITGAEKNLLAYFPLDGDSVVNRAFKGKQPLVSGTRMVHTNDLPLVQGQSLVSAEYQTMGVAPGDATQKRAMMRRFLGFSSGTSVTLFSGKRIEELTLKWIGNAQFDPTLLGYIEGAPPVPSENLTVNYDYDGASSIELRQSEDTTYSWNRSKDFNQGVDLNVFFGAGWGAEGGFGVVSKISEGKAGFRGMLNSREGTSSNSTIRAQSSNVFSDKLELKGAYETEPAFPKLGNRYVPKNVGYALVVSGLADVYITQMKRTGKMIGYEVSPVKDVPMDINTITFMINPAYSISGSLDGLVGSEAADKKFCRQVPQMRAQYGSLYPSGYYDLHQAYDIKAQIDRWDKERESYFINYDATQTTMDSLENQTADESEYDSYGGVEVDDSEAAEGEEAKSEEDVRNSTKESYKSMKKSGEKKAKERKKQIESQAVSQDKAVEANAAFDSWQQRMENLQIRAAKRNIVNTYVWDADGGMRSEEQSYANTVEHTVGGNFSLSRSGGLDTDVMVTGFKFELQALYAVEMTKTMSKTLSTTTGLDLNVRLDGVERKGVTNEKDYPVIPGEKVDRYRFMSYYLEGNTDHFNDFFSSVVDPEWLMSNDEEARALRQVGNGRANKCWRVLHRVTYVERPALMGFGEDLRTTDGNDEAAAEVFNYFDALEKANDALRADLGELKSQIGNLGTKIDKLDKEEV